MLREIPSEFVSLSSFNAMSFTTSSHNTSLKLNYSCALHIITLYSHSFHFNHKNHSSLNHHVFCHMKQMSWHSRCSQGDTDMMLAAKQSIVFPPISQHSFAPQSAIRSPFQSFLLKNGSLVVGTQGGHVLVLCYLPNRT